ncbi:MAG TPA: DUF1360 domain-containing protein [Candidatus Paceibacterota bacterium]
MKKSLYFGWDVVALLAFTLVNVAGLYYFRNELDLALSNLSWMTLLVLGLGVYRLTDIIVYEKVTQPIRFLFIGKAFAEEGKEVHVSKRGLQAFFHQLFSCNSCMGVWVAALVVYLYILFPTPTFVAMIIFALTALERLFSKVYSFLEKKAQ